MRGWGIPTIGVAVLLGLVCAPAFAEEEMGPPIQITAADAPIDTVTGHAAPFAYDWDGDGLWDLLVGQMGGGKLRIYRNVGREGAPRFEGFETFQVDGKDATVPSG
jgi:hypothetical protein